MDTRTQDAKDGRKNQDRARTGPVGVSRIGRIEAGRETRVRAAMRPAALLAALVLALLLAACAAQTPQPFRLTVAHVNDTHSALDAVDENLTLDVDGAPTAVRAKLGGMARLKTGLDALRAKHGNVLTLHAGDAVQGTLYFNVFEGAAEFDFLNALGLDAMCLGNHEFDKGPAQLGRMLALARFPVLASNVDATAEPALAGRLRPYVLRRFATPGGEHTVAVIGSTTQATPLVTADVGRVRFNDPAPVLRALVRELEAAGINKIILLSHNGYDVDQELARSVPGLDVIVGGHTHTLLDPTPPEESGLAPKGLKALGLSPTGPYPTIVSGPHGAPVLIVQAWKWGEVLGQLSITFDAAGRISQHSDAPELLVSEPFSLAGAPVDPASALGKHLREQVLASGAASIAPPNPALLAKLAPYAAQIAAYQNAPLGVVVRTDLLRGTATDPGPLVADAYLAKVPGAQIALISAGGIRRDLLAGPVTQGQVMGVLPFGNSLVAMDITGAQLLAALEDAVEFRLAIRPPENNDPRKLVVVHSAGFSYSVHPLRPRGSRVDSLTLLAPDGAPFSPAATYRLVTNSFLANGGDGLATLKSIARNRVDTGLLEHDALAEHLRALGQRGSIEPPAAPRVVVDVPAEAPAGHKHSALRPLPGARWAAAA